MSKYGFVPNGNKNLAKSPVTNDSPSGYDEIPLVPHTNPDGSVTMVKAYSLPGPRGDAEVFDDFGDQSTTITGANRLSPFPAWEWTE